MTKTEIKEQLRQEIIQYIETNHLKQSEAAIVFKTQQPNLNKLVKGRLDLFSIDRLITLLLNAGFNVTIIIG